MQKYKKSTKSNCSIFSEMSCDKKLSEEKQNQFICLGKLWLCPKNPFLNIFGYKIDMIYLCFNDLI